MTIIEDDPSRQVGESTDSKATVGRDFKTILDVPFVTVVRIRGQYIAEVILSGVPAMDQELINLALDKVRECGAREWFRKFGKKNKRVAIYFMPDPGF